MGTEKATVTPASFGRRLGAIFYDSMLYGITVLLIGSIISSVAGHTFGQELVDNGTPFSRFLFIIQVGLLFALFGWSWTHGGQTIGMRAWKIRVVTNDGYQLNWQQAFFRFISAFFSLIAVGVGFLIALFDAEKLGWHDRFSRTRLVRV